MPNAAAFTVAILSCAVLLWSLGGGVADDRPEIGLVEAVAGQAFVVEGLRRTILVAGTQLHPGDTLAAGAAGPFQVTFAGDTRLTVDAGAAITLSPSVFRPTAETAPLDHLVCDLGREISGLVLRTVLPKVAVVVPAPSIGVRG